MIAQEIKEIFPARTGTPEQIEAKRGLALGAIALLSAAQQTYETTEQVLPGVDTVIEKWVGLPDIDEAKGLLTAFDRVCSLHDAQYFEVLDRKDLPTTSSQQIHVIFNDGFKKATFAEIVEYLKEIWL